MIYYATLMCIGGKMSMGRKLYTSARGWGCEEEQKLAMLLFVQRIRELLLHTTSMAAKPLVASPLVIAREILFLLIQHSKTPHTSTEANVAQLIGELTRAIADDEVAKAALGDRWNHLRLSLGEFRDGNAQVETARYLIGRFEVKSYTANCSTRITTIIESGGKQKSELLKLSEAFIAAIKEAGYPTQTIYHLLNVSFFDSEKIAMSARARLEKFFSNFDFEYHSYIVSFGLTEIAKNVTETFTSVGGVYAKKDSPEYLAFVDGLSAANSRFFLENSFDGIVDFKDIKALDPQSARVTAEKRLRLLDDLLRFSVHRRRFSVRNQALVLKEKSNQYVNSNRPKAPVLLVPHDSDVEHHGLMDLASALRRTRSGSNDRFVRAIELHGTALSAHEDESQLLNIWIALETLFVSGRSGSKVKEIIESVEPYILGSWNQYVFGEIWERIEHIHLKKWNEAMAESEDLMGQTGFTQLARAIAVLKYKPYMGKFLSNLDSDPLLRHKIYSCTKWAQEAGTIRDQMSIIKEKILSDLNRVYRTRNQIVHIGGSKGNLSDVVQTGHYYLDLVLALLSFMLGNENGCKSIEQANLEAKIRQNVYMLNLSVETSKKTVCDEQNYAQLLFGRAFLA